jgi:hypothetical protein
VGVLVIVIWFLLVDDPAVLPVRLTETTMKRQQVQVLEIASRECGDQRRRTSTLLQMISKTSRNGSRMMSNMHFQPEQLEDNLLARKLAALDAYASQTTSPRAFLGESDFRCLAAIEAFRPANPAARQLVVWSTAHVLAGASVTDRRSVAA